MTFEIISALAIFTLVSSLTPGPNNIMLMASGMNYGVVRSVPHMLGIGIGFPMMVLLVGLGVSQIFEVIPYSYTSLKILCAIYLVYLAWQIATAAPADLDIAHTTDNGKPLTFLQAASFQWVNPKAWTMALTAISLYTPPERPFYSIVTVVLAFMLSATVSTSFWTVLGQQIRRLIGDPYKLRIFNIACAVLLVTSLLPILS
ncbi:MAG: LysE family translocator [Pseudomonadota bacterium]